MNRLLKLPVIAAVLLTAVSFSVNRRQAEKARELFSHGMEMVELGGGEMAMSDFKKAEPILAEIGEPCITWASATTGFRYTCFVSEEGLNIQLLDPNTDRMTFATYATTVKHHRQ